MGERHASLSLIEDRDFGSKFKLASSPAKPADYYESIRSQVWEPHPWARLMGRSVRFAFGAKTKTVTAPAIPSSKAPMKYREILSKVPATNIETNVLITGAKPKTSGITKNRLYHVVKRQNDPKAPMLQLPLRERPKSYHLRSAQTST